jgi:carbon storage regulator
VLSRKPNEVIRIGDDIKITVTKLSSGRVWIGVEAPKHIKVDRKEIRDKINAEKSATDSDCD